MFDLFADFTRKLGTGRTHAIESHDRQSNGFVCGHLAGAPRTLCELHRIAGAQEPSGERGAERGVVGNNQDSWFHVGALRSGAAARRIRGCDNQLTGTDREIYSAWFAPRRRAAGQALRAATPGGHRPQA
jgi:hypothetical protein